MAIIIQWQQAHLASRLWFLNAIFHLKKKAKAQWGEKNRWFQVCSTENTKIQNKKKKKHLFRKQEYISNTKENISKRKSYELREAFIEQSTIWDKLITKKNAIIGCNILTNKIAYKTIVIIKHTSKHKTEAKSSVFTKECQLVNEAKLIALENDCF